MGTSLSFIRIACGFESSYTLYVLHVLANFKHLSMTQLLVDKRAFIAAIADDNGYGWAVAKSLAATGVEVLIGLLMEIFKVYPLDAVYDNPEDVPKNVKNNKRHAGGASISLTYMGSESFIPGKRCRQASHQITEALYLHLVVYRNNILTYNGTEEVGNAAAFLASSLASAITGAVIYVHNGLDAMGDGAESLTF
ncbi:Enoyl-(acyl-carrier-protein) reductase (NADH) [Citrus sinensis]|uniref:Enoyl-(Acyl-carrier-protein) reductase (NADH) n=1 Tax=Citrus sinensis TaxID=2711 RepID=A0ACB8JXR2_CITSI|nr:Enoyl-(acyl-carrier-protein) reductase (NADH) [Citrus sinensis]